MKTKVSTFNRAPARTYWRTDNGAIRIQSVGEIANIEYRGTIGTKEAAVARYHRIPDSLSAFCKIVSFTVTKTSLILDVSVACVILH